MASLLFFFVLFVLLVLLVTFVFLLMAILEVSILIIVAFWKSNGSMKTKEKEGGIPTHWALGISYLVDKGK